MVGGWGRERGVVEIIIPIDVAPIIIAIIALSPLLFFLFSLHNKAAKKIPTMNSNLSAQTSLERSSLFVSCPPRPCKRSKAPKKPPSPPPSNFFRIYARCWESELDLPVRDSPLSTHVRGGTVAPQRKEASKAAASAAERVLPLSLSHTHTITQRRSKLDGKGNGHKHIFLLVVVWEFLVDQICLRTRFLRPRSGLNNEIRLKRWRILVGEILEKVLMNVRC
jgi:hypothetical protein